ncbi:pyruvate kinase [Arenibacter lacus]|uniref:pyruvate kinase n=1 Tax=Arenibacter lacus TaxID=2608629 RepID=UPI00168AB5E7|nr:pyruvate kinase [Arenibacter lacus]
MLKVGDKLYNVSQNGFTDFMRYTFSEVVRLTKTLAILENGERLRNVETTSALNDEICYAQANNRWVYWYEVTDEVLRLAQEEEERIAANDWFNKRDFSLEEKRMIYKFFQEKGQLQPESIDGGESLENSIENLQDAGF